MKKANLTKETISLIMIYSDNLYNAGITATDVYNLVGDLPYETESEIIEHLRSEIGDLSIELAKEGFCSYSDFLEISNQLDRIIRKYNLTLEEYGVKGIVTKSLELLIKADMHKACKEASEYADIINRKI